jgi:N-glycosylase/DNA lyase
MWLEINCKEHINLEKTLFSGQVFNFEKILNLAGECLFIGNIYDQICVLKQQDLKVIVLDTSEDIQTAVERFFNCDVEIDQICEKTEESNGLRFITNSVIPTIFSFICSSNNNIKRISSMVKFLYSRGSELKIDVNYIKMKYGSDYSFEFKIDDIKVNKFPDLCKLVNIKDVLISKKFGYRSKFICEAANFLIKNEINWNTLTYKNARDTLLLIKGVGRKVADCICLMSLKFFHVVPLDTHIFRTSKTEFNLLNDTLSERLYFEIQQKWIEKYGQYAGIVQLYKFKRSLDSQPGRKRAKPQKNDL